MVNIVKHSPYNVLAALDTDPVDMEAINAALVEWEKEQSVSQLVDTNRLVVESYIGIKSELARINSKLDAFLDNVSSVAKVNTQSLTAKFVKHPYLIEGYTVETVNGASKVFYKGKSDKMTTQAAYNKLLYVLKDHYGYKEIKYCTISEAIIRFFDWTEEVDKERIQSLDLASFISMVLTKADQYHREKRTGKFNMPEFKKAKGLSLIPTPTLKQVLLNAGWKQVAYGSSKTIYYTKEN